MSYDKELTFAKDLALEAGQIMRRYFRAEDIGTTWKEDNTPVTVADTKINTLVINEVMKQFPADGVLGEEEQYKTGRDRIWVVDPIDGTVPFSLGIPVSTFMMALVNKHDGQPVLAVVYDAFLDHLYYAETGKGAFLNEVHLKTSMNASLVRGYGTLYGPIVKSSNTDYLPGKILEALRPKSTKIINLSSGGYTAVKVASGEFDFVAMGNGLPWDSAAPALIVQEAGGIVTDLTGNPRRYDGEGFGCILAANQTVLDELLALIKAGT